MEENPMKTKGIPFLVVLFAVSSLMAQSGPDRSSGANKPRSKNSEGEITVQGCLERATGDYVLMQTDPGNTYELEQGSRKIKLDPHVGEQVVVTGWKSPSLSTSSDSLNRFGAPSSLTIMVTRIRTIEEQCTTRDVPENPVAAPVSGAQLQVSSTPDGADIEIDGIFVGQTISTVGVAPGERQLAIRKSGYKPWEKKIAISSGQVKVDAVLEPESKLPASVTKP
jgi:hypothetical protein